MGHGLDLVGLDRTGPIESFVPPIAFAILFGLSMDYEVFLMSRIREEHIHGKETKEAVRDGVAAIGRVVFAAAIIMSAVFIAFMLAPDRISKEFGLLLAVAILTDALLMRLTIVPALLSLLGEKSWYIPRWLDKVLPNITIEPPTETRDRPAVAPTARPRRSSPSSRGVARHGARPLQYSSLSVRRSPAPRNTATHATTHGEGQGATPSPLGSSAARPSPRRWCRGGAALRAGARRAGRGSR